MHVYRKVLLMVLWAQVIHFGWENFIFFLLCTDLGISLGQNTRVDALEKIKSVSHFNSPAQE